MPTKKEIIKVLKKVGTLTGSYLMGVATKNSDWDYLISYENYVKYIEPNKNLFEIPDVDYTETDEDDGWSCYLYEENKNKKCYNFIVHTETEVYKAWLETTKIARHIPKFIMTSRENRVKIFIFFCKLFKDHFNKTRETKWIKILHLNKM